jgi:hypothetical protein
MTFTRYKVLFAAAIVLTASGGPVTADELCFSPDDSAIFSFDPFPVHVTVDDIDSLMGWDIAVFLTGDPCVKIMGIIEGTLPGSNGDPTFFRWLTPWDPDSISVNGSVLGTVVDGPGVLFTIYLKALQPGTAWLEFTYSELRDGVNRSIVHDADCRARIVVLDAIAIDESSWGTIKTVFLER